MDITGFDLLARPKNVKNANSNHNHEYDKMTSEIMFNHFWLGVTACIATALIRVIVLDPQASVTCWLFAGTAVAVAMSQVIETALCVDHHDVSENKR